ncbi:hypothetical protein D3C73_991320 [compost metagenome]
MQGEQTLVVAGARLGARVRLAPAQSREQGLARLQGRRHRLGVRGGEQVVGRRRQGAFRPDHHVRQSVARTRRQLQIAAQNGLVSLGAPFVVLRDIGLDQPHHGRRLHQPRRGQAHRPEGEQTGQRQRPQPRRDQARASRPGIGQGREGADRRHRDQAQPINPDDRGELRHGRSGRPACARRIPRKAGQHMAARPLQQGEQGGEQQDAPRPGRPEPAIGHGRQPPEQPHARRQQAGRKRRHPRLRRIDQKGFGHPPAADEEIGEPRQPADPEAPFHPLCPIRQQQQQRIAQQSRQEAERRMDQGGARPGQQRQADPAPAMVQQARETGGERPAHAAPSCSAA